MLLFKTILQPRALYLRYQSSWGFCLIRKCRMSSVPLAAICQVTCTPDKEANFAACMRLVEQAKEGGASMVFLPEGFDYIGSNQEETLKLSESLLGNTISRYTQLARKLGIWLSLGGFHERGEDWETDRRIYNSHIIINDTGSIVSVYRKGHLFDVELTGKGVSLKESSFTIPGHSLMPPVQTPVGKVGLGVCYDLRFPELSLALLRHGAEILTYPSAFTVATGAAHWEWTPGERCWVTVEQLNRVWLWWRSTCRSSETPGGTCLFSSIGEMQCSTAVWTEQKAPWNISGLCALFCESQSTPHMVMVSDCPRKLFIPVLCL
nr:deaminated glutathione amidase isoform X1 [Paramormyrops kingsleyae]